MSYYLHLGNFSRPQYYRNDLPLIWSYIKYILIWESQTDTTFFVIATTLVCGVPGGFAKHSLLGVKGDFSSCRSSSATGASRLGRVLTPKLSKSPAGKYKTTTNNEKSWLKKFRTNTCSVLRVPPERVHITEMSTDTTPNATGTGGSFGVSFERLILHKQPCLAVC